MLDKHKHDNRVLQRVNSGSNKEANAWSILWINTTMLLSDYYFLHVFNLDVSLTEKKKGKKDN